MQNDNRHFKKVKVKEKIMVLGGWGGVKKKATGKFRLLIFNDRK